MAFDATPGGDPRGPWCKGCERPILLGEPSAWVNIGNDPNDRRSGLYHERCGKVFVQLTRIIDLNPWAGC